jgi:soluble lytic murein transglycosylase-like protein
MKSIPRSTRSRAFWWLTLSLLTLLVIRQHHEINRLREVSVQQTAALAAERDLSLNLVQHVELVRRYGIPYRYLEWLSEETRRYDLDLEFMVSLMQVESRFNPNAQSHKDAYGLMQVRFPTAIEIDPTLQSFWQLFEPERNIRLGTAYFRRLLDRYAGDYRLAALAYNRGPTRLDGEILADTFPSDLYYQRIRAGGILD